MPFQDTYFEPKSSAPPLAADGHEPQDLDGDSASQKHLHSSPNRRLTSWKP